MWNQICSSFASSRIQHCNSMEEVCRIETAQQEMTKYTTATEEKAKYLNYKHLLFCFQQIKHLFHIGPKKAHDNDISLAYKVNLNHV